MPPYSVLICYLNFELLLNLLVKGHNRFDSPNKYTLSFSIQAFNKCFQQILTIIINSSESLESFDKSERRTPPTTLTRVNSQVKVCQCLCLIILHCHWENFICSRMLAENSPSIFNKVEIHLLSVRSTLFRWSQRTRQISDMRE